MDSRQKAIKSARDKIVYAEKTRKQKQAAYRRLLAKQTKQEAKRARIKQRDAYRNLSNEHKEAILAKAKLKRVNMSSEDRREEAEYKRIFRANRSPEQIQRDKESAKRSKDRYRKSRTPTQKDRTNMLARIRYHVNKQKKKEELLAAIKVTFGVDK